MKDTFDIQYGNTVIHVPEPVAGTTLCLAGVDIRSLLDEEDLTSRGVRIEERMILGYVCGNDCDEDHEEMMPQVVLHFPPLQVQPTP